MAALAAMGSKKRLVVRAGAGVGIVRFGLVL